MRESPLHSIDWRRCTLSQTWINLLSNTHNLEGVLHCYPSGSRYIGHYLSGSDIDIVVYADSTDGILMAGYEPNEHDNYDGDVRSWRKGVVNLIVHSDEVMYLRTIAATELCRVHSVGTKEQRYYTHELIKGEQHD